MSLGREQELLGRLESLIGQVDRMAEQAQREDAERAEQRAAAARGGELGPDWQEVQRRIDAGQTTLRDVFGGTDDTPAAVRLREQSQRNLEILAAGPPPEVDEELAAAGAQWDRLRGPQ
jgi:hypothetical protein